MNAAKRKGTAHEVRVRDYLREQGFDVHRGDDVKFMRPPSGGDISDIVGVPDWAVQCKDTKFNDVSRGMDQAAEQAANLGVSHYCVVMHRPRTNVRRAYVILDLEQWAQLVGAPVHHEAPRRQEAA